MKKNGQNFKNISGRTPTERLKKIKPNKQIIGLGDIVAIAAKPIAMISDAVFKTNLVGCGSCAERQKKLNEMVPFQK